jgi:hypothetical protein
MRRAGQRGINKRNRDAHAVHPPASVIWQVCVEGGLQIAMRATTPIFRPARLLCLYFAESGQSPANIFRIGRATFCIMSVQYLIS